MEAKKKICKRCEKEKRIWARGLCQSCDIITNPSKYAIERKKVARAVSKIKTKKESVKVLKKRLDDIFSLYIRYKYCNNEGLVQCYTCGVHKPVRGGLINGIHLGHYWSRKETSTRWCEDNTRPQCYRCNCKNPSQALPIFGQRLRKELGDNAFDLLEIKAKSTYKLTTFEYQVYIDQYTEKVNELKKKLNIE